MSAITFKGVSSDTIDGLLISEQPDITRPARRVDNIEVDGRDGDIADFLGHESYKKTAQIGLHGNYDVDQIGNFFSGEGWVTFGNEPDKKYYARIDDNIDFERLVRFRRAKVTFIVQPWKKLVDEDDVTDTTGEFTVENLGYEVSKPLITITGDADEVLVLKINDITVCTITMPAEETITLDSEALNAYNTAGDKNQHVVGTFATLESGENDVELEGTFTQITISPNSRWL